MTQFQKNVISYLLLHKADFIVWLTTDTKESIVHVADMAALAIRFLKDKVRAEQRLYVRSSDRYSYLCDLLIDIHTIQNPSDFHESLNKTAMALFAE